MQSPLLELRGAGARFLDCCPAERMLKRCGFARGCERHAKHPGIELKQPRRHPLSVEPIPHPAHWLDQVVARAVNLHNVHAIPSRMCCRRIVRPRYDRQHIREGIACTLWRFTALATT